MSLVYQDWIAFILTLMRSSKADSGGNSWIASRFPYRL
jgi:hypothetical protein